jgi:hypothetical protein
MPLRRLVRSLAGVAMSLTALLFFGSCAKDIVKLDRNHPPQTFIVAAPLDSSGISPDAATSSYRVHLYWRGEDSDGYVVGFLWEFDDSSLGNAHYTTKTDSVFNLLVNDSTVFDQSGETQPGTSKYHTFYIRAVDNQGKVDPGIAVFNHRTFLAQTIPPTVTFVGGLPSHRTRTDWAGPGPFDSVTVELIDTLADGLRSRQPPRLRGAPLQVHGGDHPGRPHHRHLRLFQRFGQPRIEEPLERSLHDGGQRL